MLGKVFQGGGMSVQGAASVLYNYQSNVFVEHRVFIPVNSFDPFGHCEVRQVNICFNG